MEKAKLIWDFRGPAAKQIALHHAKHLSEYILAEKLSEAVVDSEEITEMHHIAFMIVKMDRVESLREKLKPHRGQRFTG